MIPYRNHTESRRRLGIGTITLLAVVVSCLAAGHARAEDGSDPAAGGALILQGSGGVAETMPAVRLGTDMDVTVSGQVLRVRGAAALGEDGGTGLDRERLVAHRKAGALG